MSVIIMKMLIVMLFFTLIETLHLTPQQMYSARGLLMNPALTVAQRQSVQNLLYVSHEKWAIKKAKEFKQLHHYKCRDISTDELVLTSRIGLLKSSKKYDGRSAFVRFSEIYVKSELLRTLTMRLSITNCISTRDRLKSKNTPTNVTRVVEMLDRLVPSETTTPEENQKTSEFYKSVWQFVDTLRRTPDAKRKEFEDSSSAAEEGFRREHVGRIDAFTKRIIWLKYDYEFKVQRSNRQIAELMCCSEETVRKSVVKYCKGVAQEILCSYSSV